jgi:hypothetical protein
MNERIDYDAYLAVSKEYIDSQQHPHKIIESPYLPNPERMISKPFVRLTACMVLPAIPASLPVRTAPLQNSAPARFRRLILRNVSVAWTACINVPGLRFLDIT